VDRFLTDYGRLSVLTGSVWGGLTVFANIHLYSLIFAYIPHIHYFLQSAGKVKIGILVKCQKS